MKVYVLIEDMGYDGKSMVDIFSSWESADYHKCWVEAIEIDSNYYWWSKNRKMNPQPFSEYADLVACAEYVIEEKEVIK